MTQKISDILCDVAESTKKAIADEIAIHGPELIEYDNYYQKSLIYLIEATVWSLYLRKHHVMETIVKNVAKDQTILDLGCATGITGLALLKLDYNVFFSDFAGAPEHIVRRLAPDRFYPYGTELTCDWVVALDVMEHVPNPISFIRWIHKLCKVGAIITYPILTEWKPPYEQLDVDNYIDTELLLPSIKILFDITYADVIDGGYELVLRRKDA